MSSPRAKSSTSSICDLLCLTLTCCAAVAACCETKPTHTVVVDHSRGPADQSFGRDTYGSFGRESNDGFARDGKNGGYHRIG